MTSQRSSRSGTASGSATSGWMRSARFVLTGASTRTISSIGCSGHSIGWYEGATLVIDTAGFEAGMLEQHPGLPHSEQLHTVERLTLNAAGDGFELTLLMEDPLYFTEPLTATRSFVAASATPQQYNCTHPELGR